MLNPIQTTTENHDDDVVSFCGRDFQRFMQACYEVLENLNELRHALSAIHKMIDSTGETADVRGLVAVGSFVMFSTWSSLESKLRYFKDETGYVYRNIALENFDGEVFTCNAESLGYLLETTDIVVDNLVTLHDSLGSIIEALKPLPNTAKVIKLLTLVKITSIKLLSGLLLTDKKIRYPHLEGGDDE